MGTQQYIAGRDVHLYYGVPAVADVSSIEAPRRFRIDFLASRHDVLCYFGASADLGRSQECQFSLVRSSASVGSRHAILYYSAEESRFYLKDEASRNKTFINGQALSRNERAALQDHDVVELSSRLAFRFRIFRGEPGAPPSGMLISYENGGVAGEELAGYLLVPGDRVAVGSLDNCAIRVEALGRERLLGWILREPERLLFVDSAGTEALPLIDGKELSLGLSNVAIRFAPLRTAGPRH